jgi:tetratricopeptide (TPR) repeat protein
MATNSKSTYRNLKLCLCLALLCMACSTQSEKVLPDPEAAYRALRAKQYQVAIGKLDTLIALAPDSARYLVLRGYAKDELAQYDAGIADFTAALDLNPTYTSALNNRGYAYYSIHDFEKANQDYSLALRLDDSYVLAYGNRALLRVAEGEYRLALSDISRGLSLGDSLNASYYNLQGYCELQLGNPRRAVTALTKAIRMEPSYKDAFENRSEAFRVLGEQTACRRDSLVASKLFVDE